MKFIFATLAVLVAGSGSVWAATPSSPFTQCPGVQFDAAGCQLLIVVTAVNGSGAATAYTVYQSTTDAGPYDDCDDTLVGILNSSGSTLKSVVVSASGGLDIYGFDGDGACASLGATCTNGAGDTSGYAGPGVNYSAINGALTSGTVNVGCTGVSTCAGIANGASAWFSLEEPISASTISPSGPPTTPATPAPSSALLGLVGLAALAAFYFVRVKPISLS